MTASKLPVVFAPVLDPGKARRFMDMPCGLTIAQIVARVAPGQQPSAGHLRVTLTTAQGTCVIEERYWPNIRPKPGTTVVVRGIPGKDTLRAVLLAVVTIAAAALAPVLFPAFGKIGLALATAGLSIIGTLLINALIPIETPDAQERRDVYRIDGWRNDIRPGAPVPCAFGRHRYAPPFAAQSYTEVVGDDQYIRAFFCLGYGPLRITDLRIGETPVSDFEDIDIETREGRPGDLPLGLFPRQVLEEGAGVQLVRPLPRDLNGDVVEGEASIETPVVRFTASNSARASVILGFPGGLFWIDDKGRRKSWSVGIRIRARLNGAGPWTEVVTLDVTAERQESFLRQHSWDLPVRGRWQIEVTRMTEDSTNTQVSDKVLLSAIQSIRPEYPINIDKPLAFVAIRVRATYQLNGSLDSFNALIQREGPVRAAGEWVQGFARNPASAYLTALMGPQNPYPVTQAGIDMEMIADWYAWCASKGLKYDRVHDAPEGLGDMLNAICGAGRASPRHDGVRWGVVIDRPQTLVIDHINPRNSDQFEWSRDYFVPPDGFRVRFLDETNNYEEAERIVPWPGHTGPVNLTESIDHPGKTDPDEIYIETRRRMYELMHRPDSFSAIQSGTARVATRGDLVMGSFDVLSRSQIAARVTGVTGRLVGIDESLTVPAGFGVRFRVYANEEDGVGTSMVRAIAAAPEETRALLLEGAGALPQVGDTVHIGPVETTSLALRIRGIEAGDDFSARLIMIAAAPEIDTLTDADVPPAWDGRVGAEIDIAAVVPAAPRFKAIRTGMSGTETPGGLQVILRPGPGSTATVTRYELEHRPGGSGVWTTLNISVAASGRAIGGYSAGAVVELRARAFAGTTPGDFTATAFVTIGAGDPAVPGALDATSVAVTGGLGHAVLNISISAIDAPALVRVYRVPGGAALDPAIHAVGLPLAVAPGSTLTYTDGDGTRSNLLGGGRFSDGESLWTPGPGWSIGAGTALHVGPDAGNLSQTVPLQTGKAYRVSLTVQDRSAGAVTPALTGGTTALSPSITANGLVFARLIANAGNTAFALLAGQEFDAKVDNITLYRETPTSVDAGVWDYFIAPLNYEDIAGPLSGPFTTTIY
jgi:hypothetical protein